MASFDLDPTFTRCIRLMHSKSKDSEDQLRAMLDDAIIQRHGSSKTLANIFIKKETLSKRESSKPSSSSGRKDDFRKEVEKKNFDKLSVEESSEANREANSSKRSKNNDVSKPGHAKPLLSGNSSPSPHTIVLGNIHEAEPLKDDNLQPEEDDDDNGIPLEILEEDLTCVVCRGMDVVARNQLVECIECHSLYHQECHQPPVAEADMNDPRSAWYCSNCTKAMSKIQNAGNSSIGKQATTSTGLAAATQSPYSASSSGSTGKPTFAAGTTKSNSSPNFSAATKTFGGLPLPTSKTTSISSKQCPIPTTSQKCVMPNINIISADKRLQIMKKKAAKMQEKRKHSK
ncbi:hypothetical protein B7P43_G11216 [Cryptotermes secundus]|uniref:Integrator complex subunit 12 n=1 Tax=Cryptotermes secundus TaxID=105785 RepID=A0A2J7QYQ7_9NEOP|nr:integrator complex subunit 12 [Cryptotermes secundus]XP_033607325.1 integrator complex subunit 12 [Cryptotermes secundus]XP_033607326.1 integrator complex subunit 12 [Cryptotermes secundus]PNF33723.1 hypothetical protein B7P43_G11216 [Cryptotermes secundus]PNF33724.1 hypothetical protein B7P43_G11216 [Cryptotermes secundus]